MYTLKSTLTNYQTFIPNLIWIFNTLFIGFLFLGIVFYTIPHFIVHLIAFLVYIVLSIYNGVLLLNSYYIFWNNGAVLVYYTNKSGEFYNSLLNISLIILTCIYLIYGIFEEKNSKEFFYQKLLLFLSTIDLVLALFIPRTYSFSITNSFSVKIVGYLFFYCFIFILYSTLTLQNKFLKILKKLTKFHFVNDLFMKYNEFFLNSIEVNNDIVNYSLVSLIIFFSLIFLERFGPLFVQICFEISKNTGLALYVCFYNNTSYYIDVIGGILPSLISIILIVYEFTKKDKLIAFFMKISYVTIFGLFLSIVFNWYLHLNVESYHGTYQFLAGFVIPSLLLVLYNLLNTKNLIFINSTEKGNIHLQQTFSNIINPSEIYIGTFLALIIFDLIQAPSSTGVYLIGGGGLSDGLLLVPLGIISGFYLILGFIISFSVELKKKIIFLETQKELI